jgi:hypothetical protein
MTIHSKTCVYAQAWAMGLSLIEHPTPNKQTNNPQNPQIQQTYVHECNKTEQVNAESKRLYKSINTQQTRNLQKLGGTRLGKPGPQLSQPEKYRGAKKQPARKK